VEDKNRRKFIKTATGFSIVALAGAGLIYGAKDYKPKKVRLRPPGAVKEDDFLSMCIKCGQCLQVCPYDSIILEDIEGLGGVGTAYIDPQRRGCYLCAAFPCILACPTGALDHEKDDIKQVHMGMAVVVNESACLALYNKPVPNNFIDELYKHSFTLTKEEIKNKKVQDLANSSEKRELQVKLIKKIDEFKDEKKVCTMCVDICPFHPDPSEAIGMVSKNGGLVPEIREKCVGCGVCEEVCPTDVIKIIPRATYKEVYKS